MMKLETVPGLYFVCYPPISTKTFRLVWNVRRTRSGSDVNTVTLGHNVKVT